MSIYFCDIEANGLLEVATKVHCLSSKTLNGAVKTYIGDYQEYFDSLTENDTMVWHNYYGYDYSVLEKLGAVVPDYVQTIDTLALSREWWPDHPIGHGLEAWAKKLGTYKPIIEQWDGLPIEDYIERCEEDCRTTEALFMCLCDKLGIDYE